MQLVCHATYLKDCSTFDSSVSCWNLNDNLCYTPVIDALVDLVAS